jgi:DNA (cytosine-5)-methyltransferase 1
MLARLQDFPDEWKFSGSKTSVFRQIGNAFPPSMAEAAGRVLLASI